MLKNKTNPNYEVSRKMPHINSFFFVSTSLKNPIVAMAMLQFFASYKQKNNFISNTAFYN